MLWILWNIGWNFFTPHIYFITSWFFLFLCVFEFCCIIWLQQIVDSFTCWTRYIQLFFMTYIRVAIVSQLKVAFHLSRCFVSSVINISIFFESKVSHLLCTKPVFLYQISFKNNILIFISIGFLLFFLFRFFIRLNFLHFLNIYIHVIIIWFCSPFPFIFINSEHPNLFFFFFICLFLYIGELKIFFTSL